MGSIELKDILRRTITSAMAAVVIAACAAVPQINASADTENNNNYDYNYTDSTDDQTESVQTDETSSSESGTGKNEVIIRRKYVNVGKVTIRGEIKYNTGETHPWGAQTSSIKVRWLPVDNAENYEVWVQGGQYKSWTKVKTLVAGKHAFTVKNLNRDTAYKFKVRASASGCYGSFSDVQTLRTARIDFDKAGWEAMCRIVYHEVGGVNDSMWNEPIVHVADCIVNQYEAAKYLDDPTWAPYYRNYTSIQNIIYYSGGFMSDAGLAADGATYANTTNLVRNAVYGAVYDKIKVDSIPHDRNVYFWCNTYYCPSGYKVGYVYSIPWGGWFSIWREYWG